MKKTENEILIGLVSSWYEKHGMLIESKFLTFKKLANKMASIGCNERDI